MTLYLHLCILALYTLLYVIIGMIVSHFAHTHPTMHSILLVITYTDGKRISFFPHDLGVQGVLVQVEEVEAGCLRKQLHFCVVKINN